MSSEKLILAVSKTRLNSTGDHTVWLKPSDWDDYSYQTTFYTRYIDPQGNESKLGTVKIGYVGQEESTRTFQSRSGLLAGVGANFFSLGQDVDYYRALMRLPEKVRKTALTALGDIPADEKREQLARNEGVYQNSLLRNVSESVIHGQFRRVLNNEPVLTEFEFTFRTGGMELDFEVEPTSFPPTNLHVLTGRNGVGKSTLLQSMATCFPGRESQDGTFAVYNDNHSRLPAPMPADYFGGLVLMSFSSFDRFIPTTPELEQQSMSPLEYVGLRKHNDEGTKTPDELEAECLAAIRSCFSRSETTERWKKAIVGLSSDPLFADVGLEKIDADNPSAEEFTKRVSTIFATMSSGHAIVLLTISSLVKVLQEKTLVLIDEPESHLHPPLLSAFTRVLSDLLINRNGVAIVATHSPVVAQEVPKSCVWMLRRSGDQANADRPETETFGENIGVLTREIFGLEVTRSGFHKMLQNEVDKGLSFEDIWFNYNQQLGGEGKSILRSMIRSRDESQSQ